MDTIAIVYFFTACRTHIGFLSKQWSSQTREIRLSWRTMQIAVWSRARQTHETREVCERLSWPLATSHLVSAHSTVGPVTHCEPFFDTKILHWIVFAWKLWKHPKKSLNGIVHVFDLCPVHSLNAFQECIWAKLTWTYLNCIRIRESHVSAGHLLRVQEFQKWERRALRHIPPGSCLAPWPCRGKIEAQVTWSGSQIQTTYSMTCQGLIYTWSRDETPEAFTSHTKDRETGNLQLFLFLTGLHIPLHLFSGFKLLLALIGTASAFVAPPAGRDMPKCCARNIWQRRCND